MGFNANVLKMDKFGNVKPFTFILSTKNYNHLGQLNNVKHETVDFKAKLNGANELSFEIYKELNGEMEKCWNDIVDLKSIYIPDLKEYFEIQVTYDDKLDEVKTITATSLCEAELGQTIIRGTEINTETDINRTDYTQTTFYNGENHKASLLHRVLSFVPQYKIKHVDASLCNLQRSFSIDGTSVYDFLTGECAEQFNCLFVFDSTDRSISVYDLYTTCNNCGHRDAYNFVCPKCGSTNVNYFGKDTDIFVNKENLSDDIKLETDVGAIKNCFRLRSGDDDMDATIIDMNPNGTRYIYHITPEQRADMSTELVAKIDSYDALVESYTEEYQELTQDIRNLTDEKTYYESTMMPTPIEDDEEVPDDSIANTQIKNLTVENLSPIGMDEMASSTSKETADIVVKNYARVFVNTSLVKIDIAESSFEYKGKDSDDWDYGIWTGRIKLTAYSDANDVATTDVLTLKIHDNYGDFLQQKVMKDMALNDEEGSIFDVLSIEELDDFKEVLKLYCLSRLRSFHMAIDTAITSLMSLDQASEEADWYEAIYVPYYNKLIACNEEITVREVTIKGIEEQLESLQMRKAEIQAILNFENYLGNKLYLEFCTYRREGEYYNEYYISDGLSSAEVIDRAKEFLEIAKKELIRSATGQHTISTSLYNLMLMSEFELLINKFALGNFIRVKAGDELYRLRLNSYHLTFSDLSKLDVEFSDMTKDTSVVGATQKILSDAQSMSTNFSYISKQASNGEKANESVNNIVQEGLNSALSQIKNNTNEETLIDNNGYLGRFLDDITGKYSPEQLRITHNNIVFTETNWASASCALGKHRYTFYDPESKAFKQAIGYGLSSKFSQNAYVYGSQIIGGDIYSENYSSTKGTYINLNDGSFSFAGGKLKYDDEIGLLVDGIIHATEGGTIGGFNIGKSAIYSGTNSITSSTKGIYLGTNGIRQYESSTANVTIANGVLTANGANITGTITAENGKIGGWTINKTTLTGGNITLNSNGSLSGGSTYTWSIGTTGAASFSNLTITGGSINVNNKFKVDSQGNVSLPAGTKLSWTDVTNQPTIPTNTNQLTNGAGYQTASQVTQITKDTVTTSFVNALKITAGSVAAENISGTTISGKTISGGTISGSTITIGSGFSVTNTGVMTCTGATVSGTVHLGIGSSLGGWKTDVNSIYSGTWGKNPTNLVFMCTGSTGTVNIAGRSESWVFGAAPNFGVTKTGEMYCSAGKIGGVTIYDDGSLRGGRVGIFPSGVKFTGNSNTFYYVIYDSNGSPIGGLTTSGWKAY